jgi:NitT/TauT family transport system ATP-binding protein
MTGQRLRQEFVTLVRENNKTAVFITHSINEALQIGDRIVVLKRPAKIAYDVKLMPQNGGAEDEAIRARILQILSI